MRHRSTLAAMVLAVGMLGASGDVRAHPVSYRPAPGLSPSPRPRRAHDDRLDPSGGIRAARRNRLKGRRRNGRHR